MTWVFVPPAAPDLPKLLDNLKEQFSKLSQQVMCYERVAVLTYGTTVTPSGEVTRVCLVKATNGTAFTMANPTKPREGVELQFDVWNAAGGAMGTITWSSEYALASAFTNPASGKHRLIRFVRTSDSKWREVYRTQTDEN